MAGAQNYALGTITPYDPNRALPYGMEAMQKSTPVVLDELFTDSVGATCSRVIMVQVSGLVTVKYADLSTDTLYIAAGSQFVVRAFAVMTTGTTATGISWGY